jgi:hypothetical protein
MFLKIQKVKIYLQLFLVLLISHVEQILIIKCNYSNQMMEENGLSFEHDKFTIIYIFLLINIHLFFLRVEQGQFMVEIKSMNMSDEQMQSMHFIQYFLIKQVMNGLIEDIFKNYQINIIHLKLIMVNMEILIKCKNYLIVQI